MHTLVLNQCSPLPVILYPLPHPTDGVSAGLAKGSGRWRTTSCPAHQTAGMGSSAFDICSSGSSDPPVGHVGTQSCAHTCLPLRLPLNWSRKQGLRSDCERCRRRLCFEAAERQGRPLSGCASCFAHSRGAWGLSHQEGQAGSRAGPLGARPCGHEHGARKRWRRQPF